MKSFYFFIFILAIGLVSAYYPGETVIFANDMGTNNLVYVITDNSTPINNLDITINDTNITVTFPQDMSPDNFDIIFFEPIEVEKIVEKEVEVEVEVEGETEYLEKIEYRDRNVTEYLTEFVEVEKIVNQTVNETSIETHKTGYELWHMIAAIIATIFIMIIISIIFRMVKNKKINKIKTSKFKQRDDEEIVKNPFSGVKESDFLNGYNKNNI